jgi:hypothetical protein
VTADWQTVSSIATAAGTLVLAAATFAAIRSSNRSARIAERALLAGMRPLLVQSLFGDPAQKALWGDRHVARIEGGRAIAEIEGDVIYLAIGLRNVGAGIALLHAWYPWAVEDFRGLPRAEPDEFRRLNIDLYVPPGGVGYWESAVRDADDPVRRQLTEAVKERHPFLIDLLYGDADGGQRTITRFVVLPYGDDGWYSQASRHWNIDRPGPR